MPKAYDQDLRDRVIDACCEKGLSSRAAAGIFDVAVATVVRWVGRFKREKSRAPVGTGGHRPSKTKPHRAWLLSLIAGEPDLTLEEISQRFLLEKQVKADTSMLSRFFIGEGIRFKKKHSARRAGSA